MVTVETSATKAAGLADLKNAVLQFVKGAGLAEGSMVTNLRHVAHLEKASAQIAQAARAVNVGQSEEALSVFIRQALEEIGMITGESVTEDVLSAIFRQFCVGK